ncbi:hypothetical protein K491DRAFT_714117 [Lophiostoma macrostomum CBS 122681]|uniref:BTB domain-containing protein n=1 Tax=Lophiostoma macrostomum CBS 122681 TaxID=1314788 RepID=A0A6A6TDQ7_9PLEO|nr:hypothetical protein K491DRAFT_714117 [Lophiostoma macrostomum CBS 122681]
METAGTGNRIQNDGVPRQVKDITDSMVKLLVGEAPHIQTFHVHKTILTQSSRFFQNAVKPEWTKKEAPIRILEDPQVLEPYIQWLYGNKPDLRSVHPPYVRLYLLGEFLQDRVFQNFVLSGMIARIKLGYVFSIDMINYLYEGTVSRSPARRLLVDAWCWLGSSRVLELNVENLPREFKDELLVRVMYHRREPYLEGEFPWIAQPEMYRHVETSQPNESSSQQIT